MESTTPPKQALGPDDGNLELHRKQAEVERFALVDGLTGLSPPIFSKMVSYIPGAARNLSSDAAVPIQTGELIRWAEATNGPGLHVVKVAYERAIKTVPGTDSWLMEPVDTSDAGVVRLSESLGKPLENLYQAGGLALVFVFVGLISMMAAFVYKPDLSNWMFGVGTAITFVCVGVFSLGQVYGPIKARKLVRENEELINSVQTVAIRLTDTIAALQSLMFKHSEQVAEILKVAGPMLANLPLIGEAGLSHTQNVNEVIVKTTETSKQIIEDVRTALVTCDATKLREYASKLEDLRTTLRETLSKEISVRVFSTAHDLVVALQELILTYTAIVEDVNARAADFVAQIDGVLSGASRLPIIGGSIEQLGGRTALEKAAEFRAVLDQLNGTTANLRIGISGRDPAALRVCLHDMKAIAAQFERLRGTTNVESVPVQGMQAMGGTETIAQQRGRS